MNGVGYTADKPLQLFLVEVPQLDAEPKVAPAGRALKALGAAADPAESAASLLPAAKQLTTGGSRPQRCQLQRRRRHHLLHRGPARGPRHRSRERNLLDPDRRRAAAGHPAGQHRTADRRVRSASPRTGGGCSSSPRISANPAGTSWPATPRSTRCRPPAEPPQCSATSRPWICPAAAGSSCAAPRAPWC